MLTSNDFKWVTSRVPGFHHLKKRYLIFLFSLEPKYILRFFRISNIFLKWKIDVKGAGAVIEITDVSGLKIFLARMERVPIYRNGIAIRIENLGRTYFLDKITFCDGDVVIDCGANVGEIGMFLQARAKVKLICFEPDVKEFCVLKMNLPKGACFNCGLWNTNTIKQFYMRNETADSSFFVDAESQSSPVEVIRLDAGIDIIRSIEKIKLFKIDGEGAEPEILMGSVNTIKKVEYISVDLGPERHGSESTLVEVFNFLTEHGFKLLAFDHKRVVALFQNRKG